MFFTSFLDWVLESVLAKWFSICSDFYLFWYVTDTLIVHLSYFIHGMSYPSAFFTLVVRISSTFVCSTIHDAHFLPLCDTQHFSLNLYERRQLSELYMRSGRTHWLYIFLFRESYRLQFILLCLTQTYINHTAKINICFSWDMTKCIQVIIIVKSM